MRLEITVDRASADEFIGKFQGLEKKKKKMGRCEQMATRGNDLLESGDPWGKELAPKLETKRPLPTCEMLTNLNLSRSGFGTNGGYEANE